jgi:hypothetical protein
MRRRRANRNLVGLFSQYRNKPEWEMAFSEKRGILPSKLERE